MLSQKVTTLTLESIEQFRSTLFDRGLSSHTTKAYASDLSSLLLWTTESLTRENFQSQAMKWLQANRYQTSPATTGRRLTSMRAWAKYAHWPSDQLLEYKTPTPRRYTAHDIPEGMDGIRKMLDYCKTDNQRALVALLGFHGLRISEALATRPSHIDLDEMELTVRGKGDKTRVVPISKEAWVVLAAPFTRALCAGDEPLVQMKDRAARNCIKALGKKARLRREIASHDLRATFATATHDATKDMRVTQELLGHSNINTTQGYVGTSKKKLRAAVESL